MQTQFNALIDLLIKYRDGNPIPFKGNAADLKAGIENMKMINHYILGLDTKTQKIQIMDLLVKLAVDGGQYCARGIRRATEEIITSIQVEKTAELDNNSNKNFEIFIWFKLQQMREKAINIIKKHLLDQSEKIFSSFLPKDSVQSVANAVRTDTHINDITNVYLKPGFIPGGGELDPVLQALPIHQSIVNLAFTIYQGLIMKKFFTEGYKAQEAVQYLIRFSNNDPKIKNFLANPPNDLPTKEYNKRVFTAVFSLMGIYKPKPT